MPDRNDIRERVEKAAKEAIQQSLGGSGSGDGEYGEFLSAAQIAERGWDLSDYNSFFGDCRKEGNDASSCGEMWTAAKEAGLAGGGGSVKPMPDDTEDADQTDVLMMMEDSESSDIAAKYLSNPIMEGDVEVVTVGSQTGQAMLQELDSVPDVPAHLVADDNGVRVGDLEALINKHAV